MDKIVYGIFQLQGIIMTCFGFFFFFPVISDKID